MIATEGIRGVLAHHEARLDSLERWVEKQNGSIEGLRDEVKGLREDMHEKFDELKDLIYESRENSAQKQSANWRQVVTWTIALMVGIPSCLWSFIQVINFLAKR